MQDASVLLTYHPASRPGSMHGRRIVSIIASPRREGYGATLAGKVSESARAAGAQVDEHLLNDMRTFRQCQNCESCKRGNGRCILDDDISPIIDAVRDADGILLCTPIAFNDADGLFKMVLDRFYCFLDANAATVMPRGKSVAVIATAGADESGAERVSKGLEDIMTQHFFCESVGRIAYCIWMMPPGMPIDDDVIAEAESIGRRLAGIGSGSS